jgi:hypothetical protein
MTPYIIERQLNVSQLDVFRLMMDRIFLGTGSDDQITKYVQAQLYF